MIKIPLTQGKVALIDDEDYTIVNLFKWYAKKAGNNWYAMTKTGLKEKQVNLLMHRLIMNLKPNERGDHKDNSGLNNQKANMRKCTHSQNNRNSKKYKNASSIYKGVSWHKRDRKWRARTTLNGKAIWLGSFKSEVEAAKAYDKFAKKNYGDFSNLNF